MQQALGEALAAARGFMNEKKITAIFIVKDGKPEGLAHVHDLPRLEKPAD